MENVWKTKIVSKVASSIKVRSHQFQTIINMCQCVLWNSLAYWKSSSKKCWWNRTKDPHTIRKHLCEDQGGGKESTCSGKWKLKQIMISINKQRKKS